MNLLHLDSHAANSKLEHYHYLNVHLSKSLFHLVRTLHVLWGAFRIKDGDREEEGPLEQEVGDTIDKAVGDWEKPVIQLNAHCVSEFRKTRTFNVLCAPYRENNTNAFAFQQNRPTS